MNYIKFEGSGNKVTLERLALTLHLDYTRLEMKGLL